jgi:hypothetical protein
MELGRVMIGGEAEDGINSSSGEQARLWRLCTPSLATV